jgi:hypothetical protein
MSPDSTLAIPGEQNHHTESITFPEGNESLDYTINRETQKTIPRMLKKMNAAYGLSQYVTILFRHYRKEPAQEQKSELKLPTVLHPGHPVGK